MIETAPDRQKIVTDAATMRARLAAAGRAGSTWLVKEGRGGMQDIELLSQAGALIAGRAERRPAAQIDAAAEAGWIDAVQARALREAHALFASVNQSGRLLTDAALDAGEVGVSGRAFLAEQAGASDAETLAERLDAARTEARMIVDEKLPPPEESADA